MSTPVILIVGATGGIGRPLVDALSRKDVHLVLAGRTEGPLADLAASVGAIHRVCDATRYDQVQAAVDDAVEHFGRIDGAVNLAGSILLKPAHLTSAEEFEVTLQQNLYSAFNLLKASARSMQKNREPGGGSIVLMSSVAGSLGLANHEAIASAKAGVEGLTRAAAATYAARQIRVNAVAPGLVRTPMASRLVSSEAAEEASAKMHPLGRIAEPEDLTAALTFLLDRNQSGFVTGQVLHVDGGFATVRPR